MAVTMVSLLQVVIFGYIFDVTCSMLVVKPDQNMETIFADNEDLYHQYQLLNTVVKRQTKGSCQCTCETKPVIRYTDDTKNKSSDVTRGGDHSAKILRTGSVNSGSQHPIWSLAESNSYQSNCAFKPRVLYRVTEDLNPSSASSRKLTLDGEIDFHLYDIDLCAETPEVDGHNQVMDGRPGENSRAHGSSGLNDQQPYGSDSAADNRDSDISWGHGSRFPWLHLPNEMCFRKQCSSNLDCCRKFNLCDRSASVCVDCWYGSTCTSEAQCCEKYPYCEMIEGDASREPSGRCVDSL